MSTLLAVPAQLLKADLLTFWFSEVGPFLVTAPKGDRQFLVTKGQLSQGSSGEVDKLVTRKAFMAGADAFAVYHAGMRTNVHNLNREVLEKNQATCLRLIVLF